jgi:microcystin degradation protein MlrC
MVRALLEHGRDLRACVTLVDPPAVAGCVEAGEGAALALEVGCAFEHRFHEPVAVEGVVRRVGGGSFRLAGPVFHGMELSMGRWAVLESGSLSVLLTERPAPTFDPEAFRQAGLAPESADLVVVRSATLFRAGWAGVADEAIVLDLPGASTPRLDSLVFTRAPRPLYPVDR